MVIFILIALNEITAAGTQHNLLNDTSSQNNSIQSSPNSTNTNSESDAKQVVVLNSDGYHIDWAPIICDSYSIITQPM